MLGFSAESLPERFRSGSDFGCFEEARVGPRCSVVWEIAAFPHMGQPHPGLLLAGANTRSRGLRAIDGEPLRGSFW